MAAVKQRNVALILARELAVNLATPMWIFDEDGELVYFNEHVAELLGAPSDIGVARLEELGTFQPTDLDGTPIPMDELPSAIAIKKRMPAHRNIKIVAADGQSKTLSVTAYPLFARDRKFVGSVAVFWEMSDL